MAFRKARDARRFARDEENTFEDDINELSQDEESGVKDILGLVAEHCDPDQMVELSGAIREMAEQMGHGVDLKRQAADIRFARDRRRVARDARSRRLGRDDMDPRGGNLEPRGAAVLAGDAALRSPRTAFDRMFPKAARVERF